MRAIALTRGIPGNSFRASCCVMLGALLLTVSASATPFRSSVAASPASVNFRSEVVGATSAPLAVTLTNDGNTQVTVTGVQSSLAQFSYSGPALPVTLPARQSLRVLVTFSPAAARQYFGMLTFTLSTGSKIVAELSGTGTKPTASVPAATAPAITLNPASQTVIAGQQASFSVAATGTAPIAYQWKMNGAGITGAISASYTTAATTTANTGETFSVTVSNSAGAATSSSATLTVNPAATAPTITSNPSNQTVIAGKTASFSVTATGTAPMSYQWEMNGTSVSGATSASYTTAATTSANSGETFSATITNSAGAVTSSSATLTVNPVATMLLSANPLALNFGSIAVGGSTVLPITLTNSGNSTVTVSGVSISGSGFTPSGVSTGQFLAPGTTTINVTFAPAENVSATGSITITSNATNSPTTISLSGTGTQVSPYSVALSWSPSTSSSVAGYNVYRATSPGAESQTSPINGMTLVNGENFTDTSVVNGTTYYYVVAAVGSDDVQSANSTEVSALIP